MTRIRLGMVGGGRGSFIGGVHRIAARMDGLYDVVAGVFSSDAERNKSSAEDIGVEASRAYGSIEDMIHGEQARADAIEAVVIATPNHLHFEARCV